MSNSSDFTGLSEETVDSFLKEEQLWEEGMDRKQKLELYKIVQLSKHTALEEERVRRGGGLPHYGLATGEGHDAHWPCSQQDVSSSILAGASSSPKHPQGSVQQQKYQSPHSGSHHQVYPQHKQQHHQDPLATCEPQEPPIRARRKKNIYNHNRQESMPMAAAELRLNADDDLVLPELVDPRVDAIREAEMKSGGPVTNKFALFLAPNEDQNRGMARIDDVLKMCHKHCTNTTASVTAEHAV